MLNCEGALPEIGIDMDVFLLLLLFFFYEYITEVLYVVFIRF